MLGITMATKNHRVEPVRGRERLSEKEIKVLANLSQHYDACAALKLDLGLGFLLLLFSPLPPPLLPLPLPLCPRPCTPSIPPTATTVATLFFFGSRLTSVTGVSSIEALFFTLLARTQLVFPRT
jgi:hypothetical protein